MDAAQALAFVAARLHPEDDPVLDPDDVADLLFLAADNDSDDNTPSSDDWTPTYSTKGCYRAIAEGWSIKYGKAVGRFSFTTDGQMFNRSQLLDHIEQQRSKWARKVQQSPSTLGASA